MAKFKEGDKVKVTGGEYEGFTALISPDYRNGGAIKNGSKYHVTVDGVKSWGETT